MSVVQVLPVSQATSKAMLLGKKTLIVAFRRPWTRDSQTALPFVCFVR
jgi:hypothetical protein